MPFRKITLIRKWIEYEHIGSIDCIGSERTGSIECIGSEPTGSIECTGSERTGSIECIGSNCSRSELLHPLHHHAEQDWKEETEGCPSFFMNLDNIVENSVRQISVEWNDRINVNICEYLKSNIQFFKK